LKKVGVAIGSLAAGAVALSGFILIAVMALAAIAVLALPLVMVSGALAFDPILVAVTEDGYWVEIDRWWS
jgi:hypothetical protein